MLDDITDLTRRVREIPRDQLPSIVGALAGLLAEAQLRLFTVGPQHDLGGTTRPDPDVNISAKEAARRLGVSKAFLYKNAARLPFTVRIGRRVVFASAGLERWRRLRTSRPS